MKIKKEKEIKMFKNLVLCLSLTKKYYNVISYCFLLINNNFNRF